MAGSLIQREDEDIYSAIKRAANSLLDVRLGRCSLAAFEILKKFSISSVSPERVSETCSCQLWVSWFTNDMSASMALSLSPRCLADGVPFTGLMGWVWWLRGVRRSDSNPNLCNR